LTIVVVAAIGPATTLVKGFIRLPGVLSCGFDIGYCLVNTGKDRNMNLPNEKKPIRLDAEHMFKFNCGPGVSCFTQCCQDVTIILTPYDVLRMKNALGIPSWDFIDQYTIVIKKEKRLIPMVVLKMDEETKRCPLISEKGCSIYNDRPWPCRMFPLEMNDDGTFNVIEDRPFCKGFEEERSLIISEWLLEQEVPIYDEMNTLFTQVTAPLRAEDLDIDNPKIYQMTFMALYNLDKFKEFIFDSTFLDRFSVDDLTIEKIKRRDIELLKFAFDWIKFGIFGQKLFQIKPEAIPKNEDKNDNRSK
jgi:uncharacterized protein